MIGKEAIEQYIIQLLSSVATSDTRGPNGIVFLADDGIIVLQSGGGHFRITVEPIRLVTAP